MSGQKYKTKEQIVAEKKGSAKIKFVECHITAMHLPDMEKSIGRGLLNSNEPLWLTAFAVYNTHHQLRLSMEFDSSYRKVFEFIKEKLK